ncbi:Alpha/Beta hydrolase protein [Phascolomyces articulosus]|uniref:Alpha/Beta hydrolase protein n=1 Tax=Phascolomyces articulosus TaxID=60185 RepID=A0AAD5K5G2_9FUNG|nr:Alpha/Beta hydrolase protein [Phascolomyces articulosus]
MIDVLMDIIPQPKSVLLALVIVFFGTKNGRKLLSILVARFIRKIIFYIPIPLRYKFIATGLQLPLSMQRKTLQTILAPTTSEKRHILRVRRESWNGDWIIPYIRKHKDPYARAEEIAQQSDVVILYFHGGGFHLGFSTEYMASFLYIIDNLKTKHGLKAVILSVDYSLSPENTYPKAQDDCVHAYRHLVHDLSISPSRIIVAGDSSGGNLAASMLLRIRDQRSDPALAQLPPIPIPAGCALISPLVTMTLPGKTEKYYCDYVRTWQIAYYRENYVPRYNSMEPSYCEAFMRQPFLSPLYGNFDNFCPTFVSYGGGELLEPQVLAFIDRLEHHHVPVTVVTRPKTGHIWIIEPHVASCKSIWRKDLTKLVDWCANVGGELG